MSGARWSAIGVLVLTLSAFGQDPAPPNREAQACKPDGWLANLSLEDRIEFKKLGWCPGSDDASPFATPIDLEVGTSITLKGAEIFPRAPKKWFTVIDLDSLYTPGDKSTYRSNVSVRPTYSFYKAGSARTLPPCADPVFQGIHTIPTDSWQVYGDVRHRVGDFPKEAGGQETTRVRQLLIGAGADYRIFLPWLRTLERRTRTDNEYPRLSATYYTVRDKSETEQDAPDGINADQIQVAFSAEIPIALAEGDGVEKEKAYDEYYTKLINHTFCNGPDPGPAPAVTAYFPWSVGIDLRGSRATTGEDRRNKFYADVALKYQRPGKKLGYVARYRTGDDLGFEYDDELLLGLFFRLTE